MLEVEVGEDVGSLDVVELVNLRDFVVLGCEVDFQECDVLDVDLDVDVLVNLDADFRY